VDASLRKAVKVRGGLDFRFRMDTSYSVSTKKTSNRRKQHEVKHSSL
jgi:hypothetical protein